MLTRDHARRARDQQVTAARAAELHAWDVPCGWIVVSPVECQALLDGVVGVDIQRCGMSYTQDYARCMMRKALKQQPLTTPLNSPAHISLNDLTPAERDRLEAGGKRWAKRFKARKAAIRLSGRITGADLAVQINEKS